MDNAGTLHNKAAQDALYQLIAQGPAEARAASIAVADEAFGRTSVPTQPATPVATPTTKVNDLIRNKNWVDLSLHPNFLRNADQNYLTKVIGHLESGLQTHQPDSWNHDEHQFAIARLKTRLKEKQGIQGVS